MLTEPLLLIEAGLVIATALLWAGVIRGGAVRAIRAAAWVLTAIVTSMVILSLPVVGDALEHSLELPRTSTQIEPAAVIVLAAGYSRGVRADIDVLSSTTATRVAAGVAYWKLHPGAQFIVTGAVPKEDRTDGRLTELMAEFAICRGVRPSSIVREPTALTTRDHAPAIARLGFARDTPLTIVTSADHMRRAAEEFRRHFTRVSFEPADDMPSLKGWRAWRPSATAFWSSTDSLHEMMAVAWYRVRSK